MKSLDLRIGNLVERLFECEHNDFEEVTVRTLWEIVQVEAGNQSKFQFEPIPLTEDWLKRFGFEQGDNVIHNDCFYGINVGSSSLGINPNNGVVWVITPAGHPFNNPALVLYIHELQNLYFCLTGQELTLAPPQR